MNYCIDCGNPVDDSGMTNCPKASADEPCHRDRDAFELKVEGVKNALTLPLIDAISKNEMPECFSFDRAHLVAFARLIMLSMDQTEKLVAKLRDLTGQEAEDGGARLH